MLNFALHPHEYKCISVLQHQVTYFVKPVMIWLERICMLLLSNLHIFLSLFCLLTSNI